MFLFCKKKLFKENLVYSIVMDIIDLDKELNNLGVQFREYQNHQKARFIQIIQNNEEHIENGEEQIDNNENDMMLDTRPKQKKDRKCGACGEIGHNRSNKRCSKYSETIEKRKQKRARDVEIVDVIDVVDVIDLEEYSNAEENEVSENGENGVYFDERQVDAVFESINKDNTCMVCLEGFYSLQKVVRMNCLCLYHSECIYPWWSKKNAFVCTLPAHNKIQTQESE